MIDTALPLDQPDRQAPSFTEGLRAWARIGVLSFGGLAAQIALMHRVVVEEKKWLSEKQYLGALSFCMLLPGPEAMQLATYAGWRLHGIAGGLAAGLLFVLPGAALILVLASTYAAFGNVPFVEAVFFGVKAAILIIVIEALMRVARRALRRPKHWWIAAGSFIAIFFFAAPFPLIVLIAALYGFLGEARPAPATPQESIRPRMAASLRTALLWLAIWFGPLLALMAIAGKDGLLP